MAYLVNGLQQETHELGQVVAGLILEAGEGVHVNLESMIVEELYQRAMNTSSTNVP